jgi:hypothetical protein
VITADPDAAAVTMRIEFRWLTAVPGTAAHAVRDVARYTLCGRWVNLWLPAVDAPECRVCRERVDVEARQPGLFAERDGGAA